MPVQRVFIVRHGETDYNAEHRWQGQLDVPLNKVGLKQAKKAAEYLKGESFDAIFASDLCRAFVTAETIAKPHKLKVIPEPRLREMHVGDFQGLNRTQMTERFPEELLRWNEDDSFPPPNGESRLQLQERAYAAFEEISNRDGLETILIVSHGGTLRMLFKKLLPPEQTDTLKFGNTAISVLERQELGWKIVTINQMLHLD